MSCKLNSLTITVVYGDKRDIYLVKKLLEFDLTVFLVGFNENNVDIDGANLRKVKFFKELITPVKRSDVLILPIAGVDNDGLIKSMSKDKLELTVEIVKSIPKNALILVGMISPYLLKMKERYSLNLVGTIELDDLAILNSIPSVEGALAKAIELTSITIHGSKSMVIGFGRVGLTLARVLNSLGSETIVAARNSAQLARAIEMNCKIIEMGNMECELYDMDIVFNTVPSLILPREKLKLLNKDCVVIDLASAPGGLDYKAANELGITAYLAPGLPGRVAPKTAGEILGDVYPRLIIDHISKVGGLNND